MEHRHPLCPRAGPLRDWCTLKKAACLLQDFSPPPPSDQSFIQQLSTSGGGVPRRISHPPWTRPPPPKVIGEIVSGPFGQQKFFSGAFGTGPFKAKIFFGANQNSAPVVVVRDQDPPPSLLSEALSLILGMRDTSDWAD